MRRKPRCPRCGKVIASCRAFLRTGWKTVNMEIEHPMTCKVRRCIFGMTDPGFWKLLKEWGES